MAGPRTNNLLVLSDTHFGSRTGLCRPEGITLQDGNGASYKPGILQEMVWEYWQYFWDVWVPEVAHDEPFAVCFLGDSIDGHPFNSVHHFSSNPEDQLRLAVEVLGPKLERASSVYFVRGTEVHVGKSGHNEEILAQRIDNECHNVIPNEYGSYSRYDLWIRIGRGLGHFLHHIGVTGSSHYESTAVLKEFISELEQAARWGYPPPNVVGRAHRHVYCKVELPTGTGLGISFVTPGWQLKTPHVWRIPGGRVSPPQFGGVFVRQGDHDLYTRHWAQPIVRTRTEAEEEQADASEPATAGKPRRVRSSARRSRTEG
jgi:hypothetical protein